MAEIERKKIEQFIAEIKGLEPRLREVTKLGGQLLDPHKNEPYETRSVQFWRFQILTLALVRIRNLIDNNLSYIESLGTLVLCRYLFELTIWLRLIEKDSNYALVFVRKSIEGQVDHYSKLLKFNEKEILLYRSLAEQEKGQHDNAIAGIQATLTNPKEAGHRIAERLKEITDSLDATLQEKLLMYDNDVSFNGYGFQASQIEKEVLPAIEEQKSLNEQSLKVFDSKWKPTLEPYLKKRWRWDVLAEDVGLQNEYEFVYAYTSRLLHANPVSILTNHQSLADSELLLFWRYIRIQVRWILAYATREFDSVLVADQVT